MDSDFQQPALCPACGRPNAAIRRTCLYCGARLAPEEEAEAAPPESGVPEDCPPPPESTLSDKVLTCPRCEGVEMVVADLFGMTIHRCPVCRGLMVDNPTFAHLIERQMHLALAGKPLDAPPVHELDVQRGNPEERVQYIHCPACLRQMSRHNYADCSGVILDRCGEHGVWLDDTELQQILTFIATGGEELAEELERRAHERMRRDARRLAQIREEDDTRPGLLWQMGLWP
ncbi:zf-TFIIB domain-containing protein [Candidatus Sumerlaeota bacterium]|nr:zf-TFIIB domain-containing protein [Candidatus Sumerlaeota bacterium]